MAMRREPTVFMNYFNCISRLMISLMCSRESFSYTLLSFMRNLYTLEMSINVEIHTGLQMSPMQVLRKPCV